MGGMTIDQEVYTPMNLGAITGITAMDAWLMVGSIPMDGPDLRKPVSLSMGPASCFGGIERASVRGCGVNGSTPHLRGRFRFDS